MRGSSRFTDDEAGIVCDTHEFRLRSAAGLSIHPTADPGSRGDFSMVDEIEV